MRILAAIVCFNTLADFAFVRFAECAVRPSDFIHQSTQEPTPEARQAFEILVMISAIVTHGIWVSYLESHPAIREFEETGGKCRHVSDGLFTPDLSFSDDWNIEGIAPQFSGSERDLEKVIKTLDISTITVLGEAARPLGSSFLSVLEGDPIHAVDLENVILDQRSIQILTANCGHLVNLRLHCSSLSDELLREFEGCQQLSSISIHSNLITDASLSTVVVGAKELSSVELEGAKINGSFLSKVEGDLSWLQLDNCGISDVGLKGLRQVPGIQELSIKHANNVTDVGISEISGLAGLTGVDLSGTRISKAGLTTLSKLESLDTLVLNGCKGIDDDCIATFDDFTFISRLSVYDTSLTEAGITRLRQSLPDCTIAFTEQEFWECPFTGSVLGLD
jgi:uncharacterized protein YjbI with pentapeptide repeats